MDDAKIIKAVVMLLKFFILSTSSLYNFLSMFVTSDSFCTIFVSLAMSNANTSLLLARLSLSCASTRARYSKLKSFTKSTKLSVSKAFLLQPLNPGVSAPGVARVGDSDTVVALVMGLPTPTRERARGVGGERTNCLATVGATRSESTTSVARPKICLFPTNPPSRFTWIH